MKLLVVAATRFEISPSIPLLEAKGIPYLITGVGMTATAYALGKAFVSNHRYTAILNVGVAGSFDKEIPLGTVVSVCKDTFYELGAENGSDFISIDELGFGSGTYYPKAPHFSVELPIYSAITVNRVHGHEESIKRFCSKYSDVKLESMEGAAVFYACAQQDIPSMQVRSISNYVERRNKSSWKMDLAITNLNNWLQNFVSANY